MKVAIAGYGVEGAASCKYWIELGASVTVFDQRPELDRALPDGVDAVLGPDVFGHMEGYDLIIRTPGLNPSHIKTDGKIWSATNEFFEKCPAQIIGVTGTKGKGTTCSLIAEILKAAGKRVHLLGNIGTPALEVLPMIQSDDIVVFELSSFQLWDIKKSPHIAVVLMVESDHQDVHEGMEDYVMAKANIGKYQNADDIMVYHPTNKNSLKIAELSSARKQQYMTKSGAHIENKAVVIDGKIICNVTEIGLLGVHNQENVCAAVTAAWNVTQNIQVIKQAVVDFKGLPHRLEFVRDFNGIKFYNDSFSSASGATIAAINSFSEPLVLLLGGYDKGILFDDIAAVIARSSNIKRVIVFGAVKHKIQKSFDEVGFSNYVIEQSNDFNQVFISAKNAASPGDVVLLSPGTSSFDMFKNFYERGEKFKQLVMEL